MCWNCYNLIIADLVEIKMKAAVVKQSEVAVKKFDTISVKEIFNEKGVENMSAAIIKLDGKNRSVKNKKCNSFYYIIKGNGKFNLDGIEYEVEEGDIVYIPKETTYFDEGKMTMISFCNPRFDSDQIEEVAA